MGDYNLAEVLKGQLQGQADPAETTRDIEAVTCEILHLKQELARNIVDIGLRLIEAKEMLSHGEWLTCVSVRGRRRAAPWCCNSSLTSWWGSTLRRWRHEEVFELN